MSTPIIVIENVKVLAVYEQTYGLAPDLDPVMNFVVAKLDHGFRRRIGYGGQIDSGATGLAGELGHIVVEDDVDGGNGPPPGSKFG